MLAAEYVLGIMDRDERSSIEARRLNEPVLDAAITAWQQRLAPLNEHVVDAQPSPHVYQRIEAWIAEEACTPTGSQGPAAPAMTAPNATVPTTSAPVLAGPGAGAGTRPGTETTAEVIQLQRRVAGWRAAAIAASALAATLVGIVYYNSGLFPDRDRQFVAIFNQGDTQPQFILSIDLDTRELIIRPVSATSSPDKSFELWIVSDRIKLRSLGLLDGATAPTRKQLRAFDPALLQQTTFGISLEPKGGSPIGKPTGPALHGKLIPADT